MAKRATGPSTDARAKPSDHDVDQQIRRGVFETYVDEAEDGVDDVLGRQVSPFIDEKTAMRGRCDAPIAIVEYIDFQCSYSETAYPVVKRIMERYPEEVKLYLKHIPLSFHNFAEPASKYFEALAMQSSGMAWKFHDLLFERRRLFLERGEAIFDSFGDAVGADRDRLAMDIISPLILSRIERDQEEAALFGIPGPPSFSINGVVLWGAHSAEVFQKVIDRLLADGNPQV
ncbi:hypothetical protein E0H62_33735 [Rhizobium leguminosarum bv. viciae]|nr:hypothetical protein E0H62_33735 [Rhizobium leguminosarum bv. viciae]